MLAVQSCRGPIFKSPDWKKNAANCRAEFEPVRVLAAKIGFSYRARQTVNLLALRLQWFESTPAQVLY